MVLAGSRGWGFERFWLSRKFSVILLKSKSNLLEAMYYRINFFFPSPHTSSFSRMIETLCTIWFLRRLAAGFTWAQRS